MNNLSERLGAVLHELDAAQDALYIYRQGANQRVPHKADIRVLERGNHVDRVLKIIAVGVRGAKIEIIVAGRP